MKSKKNQFINGFLCMVFALSISNVFAQQSIEEVVVTATLTEQSELDTPISIDILDGDTMVENNIMTMFDISDRTPGITIAKGTLSNKIYMRGVGSGGNQAFDQSVGQFVDGVYQGRSWTLQGTLLDMERVEILKGPQTTYFGNNSIGGAVSFITKTPTDESERSYSGTIGSHGEKTFTVISSGRISDGMKGRFAFSYHTMDGWLKNTNPAGDNFPNKNGFNARSTFVWDSNENLEAKLKVDIGRLETASGMGWQHTNCFADGSGANLTFVISDCRIGLESAPGFEGAFDDRFSASEQQYGFLDSDSIVLEIKRTLDNHELILVTSNQEYDSSVPGESDQSAAPFFHWRIKEESSQFSQEIRLTSNATDKSQYMIGAYYQDTDTMNYTNLARWVIPLAITRPLNIDNKTVSFFATMTFFVSEQLHVTAGLRRTKVDKDYMRPPGGGTNGPHAFDDFNLDFAHEADALASLVPDSYDENATLPSLMIQYFKDENSMFYASYSDGFKSGGYEALGVYKANRGSYGSEAVDAYEFGYKASNDKMKMSVNYFHSEYDGNQLSQYVYPDTGGVPYTTTSNIPSTNKGFELELSYLLTDSVIADLSFTNLDATYDSYEGGTCAAGISPPEGAVGCDYSGRTLLHAPENTGLFTLSSENEMPNGMTRNSSISVYWTDDQWHNTDYNVNSQEEGFSKVDARIEFSKDDWYVAILGKNLTDEYTSSWNQQTAYTLGTGQFAILERTRSVAIQFGKNF